jgi:hypothetical protein
MIATRLTCDNVGWARVSPGKAARSSADPTSRPEEILRGRIGPTVADAANTFDSAFRQPGIRDCGCHMHGRRCFCRALDGGDVRAAVVIAAYEKLYEIEREVRGRDPAEVLRQRKADAM